MPVVRLNPKSPGFPPAEWADDEYDGLVAVGGDLSVQRLLNAYSSGIFPWFEEEGEIFWFSPDPRFLLLPENFRIPKSLKRVLKKRPFELTVDRAFTEVIRQCAAVPRPDGNGTWISETFIAGYTGLFEAGFAHSFEAWRDGELAGGFYGVAIGDCFFGESMFARVPDASKCAFATFASAFFEGGGRFIDCQQHTDHLARFGAVDTPREAFLARLRVALPTVSSRAGR